MTGLFNLYDTEPILGKEIVLDDISNKIYISENDEVFYYFGVCFKQKDEDYFGKDYRFVQYPYFNGQHSKDKEITSRVKEFCRLKGGCIFFDRFVDEGYYSKQKYKIVDAHLRLAYPYSDYAVDIKYAEEDENLTREVYGLTYSENLELAEAYAKVVGTFYKYDYYPKITRSGRSDNNCDITDLLIPEKFPYFKFTENGCPYSHVSLWGFYSHLQVLTEFSLNSVFSQALIRAGLKEIILTRLFEIAGYNIYKKVH